MGTGTGIGRVRGLGSSHQGTHHWWHQRLTAGANLLLVTFVVVSLFRLPLYDYRALTLWLSSPFTSVPLILDALGLLPSAARAADGDRGLSARF